MKLRKMALGTLAIAAVIVLLAPGSVVAQECCPVPQIVGKAKLLFGVDLPSGKESPTFIRNVTQLAKEGFDSPQNAKLFLQLDSIALNSTASRPGNVTFTAPTINHIISVYDQMKKIIPQVDLQRLRL